jgi:4-alpha-glucanotransferase
MVVVRQRRVEQCGLVRKIKKNAESSCRANTMTISKYNRCKPLDKRRSGILLHPTSLPGPFANGILGKDAYQFVDFLVDAGYSIWQTLPLGPTHGDGSPYQALSVHAGNPQLLDLDWLVNKGWLPEQDVHNCFADVFGRSKCISIASTNFRKQLEQEPEQLDCVQFQKFIEEQAFWLDDFALFCALKKENQNKGWLDWPEPIKKRKKKALSQARERLRHETLFYQFEQFVFFSQWLELKQYANDKGVYLFGDLPIFVAHDSADVWAQKHYFKLNDKGESEVIAGVPPDYFSETGQRWGNPHYDWKVMEKDNFAWWKGRIDSQQLLFDVIRIDHFRGFEAYWEIPADEETAINGKWVKAPGEKLLASLYESYPHLVLVAEDLGIITEEVDALRSKFNLPGMKILQFAFSHESSNPYLPHNHQVNSVVYTGTHDNDTTLSWLENLSDDDKHYIREYFNFPYENLNQVLMSTAMASVAKLAILPFQDLLCLGDGHRMNTPGTTEGNWQWRFQWDQLEEDTIALARRLNSLYGR